MTSGLALLIPPIRAILRPPVIRFFRKRLEVRTAGFGATFGPSPFGRPSPGYGRTVYDVDGAVDADLTDVTPTETPPHELDR